VINLQSTGIGVTVWQCTIFGLSYLGNCRMKGAIRMISGNFRPIRQEGATLARLYVVRRRISIGS